MANGNSGVGVLGVMIGALLVIVVGGGLLFATGKFPGQSGGGNTSTVKVELPKPASPGK